MRDVPGAPSGAQGRPAEHGGPRSQRLSLVVGRFRGTVVVTLRGELDAPGSQRLARTLADLVDGQGNLDIVLDVGGLGRVDPGCVDVLAASADNSARRGGRLRVGRANDIVLEALATAGLAPLAGVAHDGPVLARSSEVPLEERGASDPARSGRHHPRPHLQGGTP